MSDDLSFAEKQKILQERYSLLTEEEKQRYYVQKKSENTENSDLNYTDQIADNERSYDNSCVSTPGRAKRKIAESNASIQTETSPDTRAKKRQRQLSTSSIATHNGSGKENNCLSDGSCNATGNSGSTGTEDSSAANSANSRRSSVSRSTEHSVCEGSSRNATGNSAGTGTEDSSWLTNRSSAANSANSRSSVSRSARNSVSESSSRTAPANASAGTGTEDANNRRFANSSRARDSLSRTNCLDITQQIYLEDIGRF